MTWIRRASMMAALAALTMTVGACTKGKDAPPAQPAPHTEAPAPTAASTAASTGASGQAPAGSSPAPAATVRGADGQAVALASTWESGPAVLVFYRGHW